MKPTGSSHYQSTASPSNRRPMNRHCRRAILRVGIGTLLAVMGPVGTLLATSDSWDGSTDALWSTTTNWLTDPAVVPGTGDTATFNGAGNGNTTIDLGG